MYGEGKIRTTKWMPEKSEGRMMKREKFVSEANDQIRKGEREQ